MNDVCKELQVREGKVTIGCDGEGAVKPSKKHLYAPVKCNAKYFDLVKVIQTSTRLSPAKWDWIHVKEHQENDEKNIWSWINGLN